MEIVRFLEKNLETIYDMKDLAYRSSSGWSLGRRLRRRLSCSGSMLWFYLAKSGRHSFSSCKFCFCFCKRVLAGCCFLSRNLQKHKKTIHKTDKKTACNSRYIWNPIEQNSWKKSALLSLEFCNCCAAEAWTEYLCWKQNPFWANSHLFLLVVILKGHQVDSMKEKYFWTGQSQNRFSYRLRRLHGSFDHSYSLKPFCLQPAGFLQFYSIWFLIVKDNWYFMFYNRFHHEQGYISNNLWILTTTT